MAGTIELGLPDAQYRARPGASQSALRLLERSPAHYRHGMTHRKPPTEAMTVGSALDCMLFERETFDERFVVDDTGMNRNSKAWKAWREEQGEREILREAQWTNVLAMHAAIGRHRWASTILQEGHGQPSVFWEDESSGVACKGRLDWWASPAHSLILDLKKVQDVSSRALAKHVATYGYARQAAMYTDGMAAAGQPVSFFVFLFVEEQPPHDIAVGALEPEWVEMARRQYRAELHLLAECMRRDDWPGHHDGPITLDMPAWLRRQHHLQEDLTYD